MLMRTRPNDVASPSGYGVDDLNGTIPGFRRHTIILSPWKSGSDTEDGWKEGKSQE